MLQFGFIFIQKGIQAEDGQRGPGEGVVPTVSKKIVGHLPLDLMPSRNDLAVSQPAGTGHELGSKYSQTDLHSLATVETVPHSLTPK